MTFTCTICNYESNLKANYERHLKSKRHLYKSNNIPINTNDAPINTNNQFTCEFCNSSYYKISSLNRHQTSCVKKIIQHKDKQLELYEKENKELKQKNEELTKSINKIKDKQLSVLQKNLKPANNNNSQIIINNYPNAPNIGFPDNIQSDESLNQYIQLGGEKGLGKFIYDNWGKDINPIDRSFWMVDSSRNKFLIRINDSWVIDLDGKQFQKLNIKRIHKIFDDYVQTFNPNTDDFDLYQHTKTMEFINDIKTKNMIVKGLKESGKYLVYDKEKYPHEDLVPETIPEIEPEVIVPVTETTVD